MKFRSKRDLLEAIEQEHASFVELVDSLRGADRDRPGVWGDDWTVKDLLAHLTAWEQMFLRWYREGAAGLQPAVPADGYKWNETPRLNRAIWREHKDHSWPRVRDAFDASYQEIRDLAGELGESELLTPGRHSWTKKLPLMTYLAANTSSHYRTATKILKRWLRTR